MQVQHIVNRIKSPDIDVLTKVAVVPGIVFMVTMVVDLVYLAFFTVPLPVMRTVFNVILQTFAYPVCFVVAGCTILYLFLKRESVHVAYSRPQIATLVLFGCVVVLALVSTFVNTDNPYRFRGIYPSEVGYFSYVMFFLAFFFCSSLVCDERVRTAYCRMFLLLSIPIGLFAIYVSARYGEFAFVGFHKNPEGIFYQFNHYGYYLAMTIVLAASMLVLEKDRMRRVFYAVVFELNTAILIANDTLGAWLAVLVGLVALIIGMRVRGGSFSLASIILVVAFVVTTLAMSPWFPNILNTASHLLFDIQAVAVNAENADEVGSNRWFMWRSAAKLIAERPLLGWGAEGYSDLLAEACGMQRAHNEFVSYAGYFGIPAACCYALGCGLVIVNGIRNLKSISKTTVAMLVVAGTYLFSSCFGNILPQTAPFFFIFLGFAFGGWVQSKSADTVK